MSILRNLIHPLWQLLPHKFRRTLFNNIVRFGGKQEVSPLSLATLPQPITISGYLTASTGLGQAARLAVLALKNQGIDVNVFDLTEQLFHKKTNKLAYPKMQSGKGTLILFVNPPVSSLAMRIIGGQLLKNKHRIGAWVWELPSAPLEWYEHAKLFHEFITPSDFALNAIAPVIKRPIKKVIHPVAAEIIDKNTSKSSIVDTSRHDIFRVGAIMDLGSRYARKNPEGVLLAYAKAFGSTSDVILDLKIMRAESEPVKFAHLIALIATHKLNVNLILDETRRSQILNWIASLDVMISLHASEGFGLTIAEAMRIGVPCIVTNWSANTEYCNKDNSYLVDYQLVTPIDSTGLYETDDQYNDTQKWAQADINHAAKLLMSAYNDREELSKKGKAAQENIHTELTTQVFCEQLLNAR